MCTTTAFAAGGHDQTLSANGRHATRTNPRYASVSRQPHMDFGWRPLMDLSDIDVATVKSLIDRGIATDGIRPPKPANCSIPTKRSGGACERWATGGTSGSSAMPSGSSTSGGIGRTDGSANGTRGRRGRCCPGPPRPASAFKTYPITFENSLATTVCAGSSIAFFRLWEDSSGCTQRRRIAGVIRILRQPGGTCAAEPPYRKSCGNGSCRMTPTHLFLHL